MILSRRVALNNTQLDAVHDSIVIRGIDTGVPHETISAVNRMGGFGQRVTGQHYESLDVNVTFAINIPYTDLETRRTAYESVIRWANQTGWLTVNYMPNRRLRVDKTVLPSGGDLWKWTDGFTLTFRAYAMPFWQDTTATTSTGSSIAVPGNLTTVCNAEVANATGATIDELILQAGSSQMTFSSLGLDNGETLKIGHTDDGLLTIRIYTSSTSYRDAYFKRTVESSDDLYVEPGTRGLYADSGTATFSCFGRYA